MPRFKGTEGGIDVKIPTLTFTGVEIENLGEEILEEGDEDFNSLPASEKKKRLTDFTLRAVNEKMETLQ